MSLSAARTVLNIHFKDADWGMEFTPERLGAWQGDTWLEAPGFFLFSDSKRAEQTSHEGMCLSQTCVDIQNITTGWLSSIKAMFTWSRHYPVMWLSRDIQTVIGITDMWSMAKDADTATVFGGQLTIPVWNNMARWFAQVSYAPIGGIGEDGQEDAQAVLGIEIHF